MDAGTVSLREPLAQILGAFRDESPIIEYSYADVVRMAGHACPTTAGAYICCREALESLYPDEVPVRGEVSIVVYGEEDEGVYGVMGQVFSYITGAAARNGFRGLGHRFRRKDLLEYSLSKPEPDAMCFDFSRIDNGSLVSVRFYPRRIPHSGEDETRKSRLMEKVIWEAAREEEIKEFQRLWLKKVEDVLSEKDIGEWLKLSKKENKK